MTPEEVALFLRKSTSWVYKHWQVLGGRKLGGSLLFPTKEDLYERLFGKEQGMEIRLHPEGNQAHGSLVQNQKGRTYGRSKKKGGTKETGTTDTGHGGGDPNRHGIF